jgi:hypothetical protein
MSVIKEFKQRNEVSNGLILGVTSFDQDKEIEFCMSGYDYDNVYSVYLSSNQINELISHLAQCLKDINEPIEILNK